MPVRFYRDNFLSSIPLNKSLSIYHSSSIIQQFQKRSSCLISTNKPQLKNINISNFLPKWDDVLKYTHNEELWVLKAFRYVGNVETDDEIYSDNEADVTMVTHMLAAANALKKIIRIKSNDTTIFILLVYWVYKTLIKSLFLLEKWNRSILNINETCKQLCATCLQTLGMHVLSGSETVSYHYEKCKMSAINIITGTKKKHTVMTYLTYTLSFMSLIPSLVILCDMDKVLCCSLEFF